MGHHHLAHIAVPNHPWYTHVHLADLVFGLYIVYFKQYDKYHNTIYMNWYSIHINDTFCLVLDNNKKTISTNFMGFWEYYWPKYTKFKQKCIVCSIVLTKMNDTICIALPKYQYNWYASIRYRAHILYRN